VLKGFDSLSEARQFPKRTVPLLKFTPNASPFSVRDWQVCEMIIGPRCLIFIVKS
jgi:hypothetical protein